MGKTPAYAWSNGALVPYPQAVLHIETPAVRYGLGVFEGLRAYWNARSRQLYVFRTADHYRRMLQSAKILRFDCSLTVADLTAHLVELLRANRFEEDVHIRHSLFLGGEGDVTSTSPVLEMAVAIPKGRPVGHDAGVTAGVSSWARIDDRDVPPRVKANANYLNSRLARLWAKAAGYDQAILLNREGKVAEAPAACVLLVRGGALISPPVTAGLLESVTRTTVMELAAHVLGIQVVEREVDRSELYVADEVMLVGTAAEITPVVSVDHIAVGDGTPGPITRELANLYYRVVRGEEARYRHWLTPVYA